MVEGTLCPGGSNLRMDKTLCPLPAAWVPRPDRSQDTGPPSEAATLLHQTRRLGRPFLSPKKEEP